MDAGPVMTPGDNPTVLRFGPDRRLTAAVAAGAVVALGLAVATTDAAGRLLLVGAALVLAAYAVSDLIFSPRVTASATSLQLNAPFARAELAWSQIESIAADTRERLGLRNTALEIDAGAVLAIFSRRALGTDPAAAAALLQALDPRRPGSETGVGHDEDRDDEDRDHP